MHHHVTAMSGGLRAALGTDEKASRRGGRRFGRPGKLSETETKTTESEEAVDEGIDITMLQSAVENTAPAGEAWLISGSDDLVFAVMSTARDAGVMVARMDADAAAKVTNGALVIVELPGDEAEAILTESAKNGAYVVAVLDEPTIEAFTKAVKSGARDVVAGKPNADVIAARGEKWKSKIAKAK